MNAHLDSLVVLVPPQESITSVVRRLATQRATFFGLAVVIDEKRKVLGVINSGDVIRLLANGHNMEQPVSSVMVRDPISVHPGLSPDETISEVYRQIRLRPRLKRESVAFVLVVSAEGQLENVINFHDLVALYGRAAEGVAVYGLGFVGLTLAAALASRGHVVTGIDIDEALIAGLNSAEVTIHEPGLKDLVQAGLDRGTLSFAISHEQERHGVSIIAVGTPIGTTGEADLGALKAVATSIGKTLKRGDLVMLRSTVPVGTTRELVAPLLESLSHLTAGEDFHIAFTPERTVEGGALRELRELPQIVGGLTQSCSRRAATFWSPIVSSVVPMDSLEAAELVKLANNSFRDVSFAFANGLAVLADQYNVNAFRLVMAANEGYPRNPIPLPGPGVGGYCLTKDPLLFASTGSTLPHADLARMGRRSNSAAATYPVEIVRRFAARHRRSLAGLEVLIVGIAFKGLPETNDTRGSTSIEVGQTLLKEGAHVRAWDAIVPKSEVEKLGFKPAQWPESISDVDVILILNNHPQNVPQGLASRARRPMLVFDGWSLLDPRDVEQHPGLAYATMGYLSEEL